MRDPSCQLCRRKCSEHGRVLALGISELGVSKVERAETSSNPKNGTGSGNHPTGGGRNTSLMKVSIEAMEKWKRGQGGWCSLARIFPLGEYFREASGGRSET